MFSTMISTIPIWSEDLGLFDKIRVTNTRTPDVTLPSVLRALVEPRLQESDVITYAERRGSIEYEKAPNAFTVCFMDEMGAVFTMEVDEKLGWKELKDVQDFIFRQTNGSTRILVNEEIHSVCIFCRLDNKILHVLSFFVPRYFPWLFKENRPNASEMRVLNSLLNVGSGGFMLAMKALAEERGLVARVNAEKVARLAKIFVKNQYNRCENEWRNAKERADSAFEAYKSAMRVRNEAVLKLEGAKARLDSPSDKEENELSEFIKSNSNFKIKDVSDTGRMQVVIENYLDVYDADGFEYFVPSFFEQVANEAHWNVDDTKQLLSAIFSADPEFRIKTCGYYMLDLEGYCETRSGYEYEYEDRIPNPHLQYHACLGQNEGDIEGQIRDGNLLGALMQCNASCMSVNIHETGVTFRPFCRDLLKHRGKVLRCVKTGEDMTPAEALAYLKSSKEEPTE